MDNREVRSSGVRQNRNVEITHFGTHDAVINKTFLDQTKVRSLVETVRNGIPSTWTELPHDTGSSKIYRDSEENPRYVAKIRAGASPSRFKEDMEDEPEFRRLTIADNSIVNEIKLSPAIRHVLEMEEAQQIARNYGFESIALVEPLIGLINRTSGEKIVFYEWQKGYSDPLDTDLLNPLAGLKNKNFIPDLERLFLANNIDPGDLSVKQLIADRDAGGKPHLHLIDTQEYVKLQAT